MLSQHMPHMSMRTVTHSLFQLQNKQDRDCKSFLTQRLLHEPYLIQQAHLWGTSNIRIEGMNCHFWPGLRNELGFLVWIEGMNRNFWSGLKEWIAIFGPDWGMNCNFWPRLRNELACDVCSSWPSHLFIIRTSLTWLLENDHSWDGFSIDKM